MRYYMLFTVFFVGVTTGRQIGPICSKNEEFLQCGTACPATCSRLYAAQPIKCIEMCISGCFCKDGYVRDERRNNICVPQAECQSVPPCARNEVYAECGPYCPLTCQGYDTKPCPDLCRQGCMCAEGYVRSTLNGPCVPQDSCDLYNK